MAIITAILLITALPLYVTFLGVYLPQSKYRQGLLFAVRLPEEALESAEIRRVRQRFNKQMAYVAIGMALLLAVLLVLLHKWVAYQMIGYVVWMIAGTIGMVMPFRRAFRDTLAAKRLHNWYVGPRNTVWSDLRVAQLKNERAAPMALFAVPAALSAGLIWLGYEQGIVVAGIAAAFLTAVLAALSLAVRASKTKVYSRNSEVNVALNQHFRRMWTYALWWVAVAENVHAWLAIRLALTYGEDMFGFWLTAFALFTLLPIGVFFYAHRNVRRTEREMLAADSQVIYSDDDEYWGNGFTYHNPKDRSLFVEKRVGIGMTINTGTLAGKIIVGGIIGVTVGILAFVLFLLVRSELTDPEMIVTPERVDIRYPMYNVQFDVADIEQLALVDDIPSGAKVNGEATERVARGHFRLKELGTSRLYVFKNQPPYIQIKLSDGYIFYNERDPQRTEQLYEQLRQYAASGHGEMSSAK